MLEKSGHIESVAIITEEAIAKGIRRIVALTGAAAIKVYALIAPIVDNSTLIVID